MNCLLVMKIKWSLDINTGAVERSEAARTRRLAGATVGTRKWVKARVRVKTGKEVKAKAGVKTRK